MEGVLRAACGDRAQRGRQPRGSEPHSRSRAGARRIRQHSTGSAQAFAHATGAEGLSLIDGQAGTGKSYTIACDPQAYEAAGHTVIGLAPTNAVAQDMQRDGFRHAATVHSELFALNNGRRQWDARTVVVVDEAAMLDTKLMAVVTEPCWRAGAKLILVGDDRQLSSIDRGGMFGALKDRHGAAALTEVTRQHKDEERRAAEMMAEGNFADALGDLRGEGRDPLDAARRTRRARRSSRNGRRTAPRRPTNRGLCSPTRMPTLRSSTPSCAPCAERRASSAEDHELDDRHGRQPLLPATGSSSPAPTRSRASTTARPARSRRSRAPGSQFSSTGAAARPRISTRASSRASGTAMPARSTKGRARTLDQT